MSTCELTWTKELFSSFILYKKWASLKKKGYEFKFIDVKLNNSTRHEQKISFQLLMKTFHFTHYVSLSMKFSSSTKKKNKFHFRWDFFKLSPIINNEKSALKNCSSKVSDIAHKT